MCSTVCQTCKCWMGSWNCQRTALHQKPIFCLKYAPYYNIIFCDGTEGIAMFNGINPIDTQVCSLFEWSRSGLSAFLGCQRCPKSHDGKPPSVSTSCGKHVFCIIKLYQNLPYTISKLFYGSLQGLFHHEKWGLVHTHRHTLLFMWSSHVHVFTTPITPPSLLWVLHANSICSGTWGLWFPHPQNKCANAMCNSSLQHSTKWHARNWEMWYIVAWRLFCDSVEDNFSLLFRLFIWCCLRVALGTGCFLLCPQVLNRISTLWNDNTQK